MKKESLARTLEILFLIGLVPLAGNFFSKNDPFLINLNPHPFWVVIVFISLRYANPWGTLAGFLCAAVQLSYLAINGLNFSEAFQLGGNSIINPFLYIVAGAVISEEINKHKSKQNYFHSELDDAKKVIGNIEKRRGEIEAAYRELEGRIAGSADTLVALRDHLRSLDGLEGENLYRGICNLICHFLNADSIDIWRYAGNDKWRCLNCDQTAVQAIPELGQIAIDKKQVVTAREFINRDKISLEAGRLAGLLYSGGNIKDVIVIREIGFKELTPQNINFFELILEWVSNIIERQRIRLIHNNTRLYESGLGLASEHFFYSSIKKEISRVAREKTTSSLLMCNVKYNFSEKVKARLNIVLAACIRQLLRNSDTASFIQTKRYFAILLPMTSVDDTGFVKRKLQEALDFFNIINPDTTEKIKIEFETHKIDPGSSFDVVIRQITGFANDD